MLSVTKRFEFCYAHYLPDYNGPCKSIHGHNAICEVEIGENKEVNMIYPTMVIDFRDLKGIIEREIIAELDHRNLNELFVYPTAESIVKWIWGKLKMVFGDDLVRVKVTETPDSWAEIKK